MAATRGARAKKDRPDPPSTPDEWEPAPAAVESGAVWDCVQADADVTVPEHVVDFELRESRWVDADLSGRHFAGLRCRDTQFMHCDLSGAVLDKSVFTRVTFTNCRLTGVVLSGAELGDVRISDSRADLASFRMARGTFLLIENTLLHAADFWEFTGADCGLVDCDLSEANFEGARLSNTQLHGSTVDDVRGALSLRGSRISPDQLVALGAAVLAELDIQVSERRVHL